MRLELETEKSNIEVLHFSSLLLPTILPWWRRHSTLNARCSFPAMISKETFDAAPEADLASVTVRRKMMSVGHSGLKLLLF